MEVNSAHRTSREHHLSFHWLGGKVETRFLTFNMNPGRRPLPLHRGHAPQRDLPDHGKVTPHR
jgi:hypothetical protein